MSTATQTTSGMISIDGGEPRRCDLSVEMVGVSTYWSVRIPGQLSPVVREVSVRIEVGHATLEGRARVGVMGLGSFYLNGDGPLAEVSRG